MNPEGIRIYTTSEFPPRKKRKLNSLNHLSPHLLFFFCKSLMSAGLVMIIHGYDTGENWMQYSADHIATTALLPFQNGPRSNLRASI